MSENTSIPSSRSIRDWTDLAEETGPISPVKARPSIDMTIEAPRNIGGMSGSSRRQWPSVS